MWTRLKSLFLVSFLLFVLVPSYGTCSEISDQQTITISQQDWNKLRENNKTLSTNLNQLEQELSQAKEQLQISKMGLNEAQVALIESNQEIQKLKAELQNQKKLSQELQNQLQDLKNSSQTAEDSLKKTNESLQGIVSDVRAEIEEHKRTEKRLRTQKTLWQIVAIGCGIWAVSK